MCPFHLQGLLTFTLLLPVFFTEVLWHTLVLKRTSSEAADLSRCWTGFCPGKNPATWCQSPTFSEPPWKQTRFKRGWREMMTLWHTWKRHNWGKGVAACRSKGPCPHMVAPPSGTFIHRSIFHFHWVTELKGQFSFSYSYLTERELYKTAYFFVNNVNVVCDG